MRQEVRDGWLTFTEQFEGHTNFMYLDVKGLVTIGYGNLVDPQALLHGLTFTRPDGSIATASEVSGAWLTVKNRGDLKNRGGGAFAGLTTIRATDESIARLVGGKLDAFNASLCAVFPSFEQWPAPAQTAALSMCWAMGTGFLSHWTVFVAACQAEDWAAASMACHMRDVDNPGLRPRNTANAALFRSAMGAGVTT